MRTRAAGEYKDMGSLFRETTPEEDAKLDALIHSVYERFVDIVARAGPNSPATRSRSWPPARFIPGPKRTRSAWSTGSATSTTRSSGPPTRPASRSAPRWSRPKRGLLQMLMTQGADSVAHALVDAFIDRLDAARAERLLEARLRLGR